jgi:indole-3-glycerol phosphate synthase
MPATLEDILADKRRRVAEAKQRCDWGDLESRAEQHRPRGFVRRLRAAAQSGTAIIAELKRASPSRGAIRPGLDVSRTAAELVTAGASALSVLTEEDHFQGSVADLREASRSAEVPCLRKDFVVDEFQLLESRANSADAVLLIVSALNDAELTHFHKKARGLELDVLVEVHSEDELQRALGIGCEAIGVNSRDLRTFHVDLQTPMRLASQLPSHMLRIAESGIGSREDVLRLRRAGYDAFLIGESLMKAGAPAEFLRNLLGTGANASAAEQPA